MYLLILLGVAFATATLFFKQKLPTALLALASFAWYFEAWQSDGLLPFIIFSVGVAMVILEFYLPQTGFAGLIGSVVMGLVLQYHTQNWQETWLLLFGIGLVGVTVFFVLLKFGLSIKVNEALILDAQIKSHARGRQGDQTASADHPLIGHVGHAISDLKPIGKVEVDGQVYEARSAHNFISQGARVEVQAVSQGTLVVRKGGEA